MFQLLGRNAKNGASAQLAAFHQIRITGGLTVGSDCALHPEREESEGQMDEERGRKKEERQ